MEQSRNDRITRNKKLQLPNQVRNIEHFLNEGKIYLDIADNLHKYNEKSSTTYAFILKVLDIYTKLKTQFREDTLELHEFLQSLMADFVLQIEHPDEDDEGNAEDDVEPIDDFDDFEDESEEDDFDDFDDIDNWDHDFVFDNYENYLDWHGEVSYRKVMLTKIELMIARIQDLCAELIRSRLSLYRMLANYGERVRLFLRRSARFRRSAKFRQRRNLIRGVHYKYNLLRRLLARVDEEQENIVKDVGITCNKEI